MLALSGRQVEQLFSARAWHLPLWEALGPTDLLASPLLSSSCLFLSLLSNCQSLTLGYSSDKNERTISLLLGSVSASTSYMCLMLQEVVGSSSVQKQPVNL